MQTIGMLLILLLLYGGPMKHRNAIEQWSNGLRLASDRVSLGISAAAQATSQRPSGSEATPVTSLLKGLAAERAAPELGDRLQLFGQFVGDWEIDSVWFLPDGSTVRGKGEVHFGWILKGMAIQDVWSGHIANPPPGFPKEGFGTTVRFYDPKINGWQCVWVDPVSNILQTLIARKIGDEIVLETKTREGYPEHWIYSKITPQSFEWRSVESHDGEKTWKLTQKISARRVHVGS